ncbi:hypothetical protein TrLO_g718 [Triparma laevis f. longispina]|uniref:Nuclease associated modular domain-containing protein n=1 Tax=Triparma laevis f. longispina TaxID=1714387 RepID=A0A9W7FQW1_9STRA|nr:hypothetical protein TrLO_g718 [Triparma laevis f. longispina]
MSTSSFTPMSLPKSPTPHGGTPRYVTSLGIGQKGRPHTAEAKAKISAANKGKKPWNVGLSHSESTRQKIRASVLARLAANGGLAKPKVQGPTRRGGPLSDEIKKKISVSMKLKWTNSTFREERLSVLAESRSNSRGVRDGTTKAKISASLKSRWQEPEFRERQKQLRKERGMDRPSEEIRRKISESLKERWKEDAFRERMRRGMNEGRLRKRASASAKAMESVVEKEVVSKVVEKKKKKKEVVRKFVKKRVEVKAKAKAKKVEKVLKVEEVVETPPIPPISKIPKEKVIEVPEPITSALEVDFDISIEPDLGSPPPSPSPTHFDDFTSSTLASSRLTEINEDLWNLIYGEDDDEEEEEEEEYQSLTSRRGQTSTLGRSHTYLRSKKF